MNFRGINIGKIIETVEDLMDHSYPLAPKTQTDSVSVEIEPLVELKEEPVVIPEPVVEPVVQESIIEFSPSKSEIKGESATIAEAKEEPAVVFSQPTKGKSKKK